MKMVQNEKPDEKYAKLILDTPPHYDLVKSIHAWIYPDVQPVPEATENRKLHRILTLNGINVPVTISQAKSGSHVEIQFPTNIDTQKIQEKVRFTLGFDVDTNNAIERIREDNHICYLAEEMASLRPYTADTLFEGLAKSILQQQISFRAANVITRRVVLETCSPLQAWGTAYYGFPAPHDILALGSEGLRRLGVGYKTDYLLGVSSLFVSGELNLEELKNAQHNQVVERLHSIRGIGDWTIKAFAISSLHDFSVFPYGDLGVRNLLGRLYTDDAPMKTRDVEEFISRWGSPAPLVLYLLMCADVLGLVECSERSKKP